MTWRELIKKHSILDLTLHPLHCIHNTPLLKGKFSCGLCYYNNRNITVDKNNPSYLWKTYGISKDSIKYYANSMDISLEDAARRLRNIERFDRKIFS